MKLPALILSGSLALNVLLLAPSAFSTSSGISNAKAVSSATRGSPASASSSALTTRPAAQATEPLSAIALAEVATRLRAAGLPAQAIRAAIDAELNAQFSAREAELLPPKKKLTHWWQVDTTPVSLETRVAQVALWREKSRLRFELIGPDPDAPADGSALSPAKLEQAEMLTADYDGIVAAMRTGIILRLFTTAEREALQFLESEKKRELSAMLTPEEAAEWEFRTSPAIDQVRRRVHGFDATPREVEILSDYYRNQAAASKNGLTRAIEKELDIAAESALGPERFADFKRSQNPEFNQLRQLAQRLELPSETAVEVFDLRTRIERESARIGNDVDLSNDGKSAALKNLADDVRQDIVTKLGPAGSAAYMRRAGSWLGAVERGEVIEFTLGGWSSRAFFFPPPYPPPVLR